jgi:putative transposase
MSRLRRLVVSDRFFFVTCRLLARRGKLQGSEFERLARVVRERREKYHFLLTAWVFLPDHWHAIIFPRYPLTISRAMESIKVGSTHRINSGRRESGLLSQPRFFDRAVRAGLVERAEDWPWSSVRDYAGNLSAVASGHRILPIDRILLPADARTRI